MNPENKETHLISIKELKAIALNQLKGRWLKTWGFLALIFLTLVVINFVLSVLKDNIAAYMSIYLVLTAPFSLALFQYFLKLAKNQNPGIQESIPSFRLVGKFLLFRILNFILMCIGGLFLFLPGMFVSYTIVNFLLEKIHLVQILQIITWSINGLCLVLPGVIVYYMFCLTEYILIENPSLSVIAAMKQSRDRMKNLKMKRFLLDLSFLGWYILAFMTLGIGLFWVLPFYLLTVAQFYVATQSKETTD